MSADVLHFLADLMVAADEWADGHMPTAVALLAEDAGVDADLVRDAAELAEIRLRSGDIEPAIAHGSEM
ncbi:hypothetical protein [Halopelagius fulvigenes]|uniref:Uncharacterized protein n=1 Tax=Halopelagius fulvigenes TaxID=1198324 RepID=A0ABD5TYE8_9EURY